MASSANLTPARSAARSGKLNPLPFASESRELLELANRVGEPAVGDDFETGRHDEVKPQVDPVGQAYVVYLALDLSQILGNHFTDELLDTGVRRERWSEQ